jgi:Tol biopolymer transport system component
MGDFEVCVAPAKGGEAKVLVSGEDASWAPDSRHVVFTRRLKGGQRVLSVLDVSTKQFKDVEQVNGVCSQPCWAR